MRLSVIAVIWATFVVIGSPLAFGSEILECRVVSVHDGDSMRVRCPQQRQSLRVRMHQIDAPELEQPYGAQSRDQLKALCPANSRARIHVQGTDQYGRLLGDVYCRGKNLNHQMVASGAAWAYRRYVTDTELPRLQRRAEQARRGRWGESNPIQPWRWRYEQSHRR